MNLESIQLPHALLGNAVVIGLFILVVWALLREAARWVIRGMVVVGVIVAIGLATGILSESVVGHTMARVGDGLIAGIATVTEWLVRAWEGVSGESM
jgi:uncharacterized membrane protein YczE